MDAKLDAKSHNAKTKPTPPPRKFEDPFMNDSKDSGKELFPAPSGFDELSGLDLSHLSAEERMVILQVAARAKQIEQVEQQKIRNIEDQLAHYSQNARDNVAKPSPPTPKKKITSTLKTKETNEALKINDVQVKTEKISKGTVKESITRKNESHKIEGITKATTVVQKKGASVNKPTIRSANEPYAHKKQILCYLCSSVLIASTQPTSDKTIRRDLQHATSQDVPKTKGGGSTDARRLSKGGKSDTEVESLLPVVCSSCGHTVCVKCSVKSTLLAKNGILCALCAKQRELVARSNLWLKSARKSQLYRSQSADTSLNPTASASPKENTKWDKLPWHRRSYSDSGRKNFGGPEQGRKTILEETPEEGKSKSSPVAGAQTRRSSWVLSSRRSSANATLNFHHSPASSLSSSSSSIRSSIGASRSSSVRKSALSPEPVSTDSSDTSGKQRSPQKDNVRVYPKNKSPSRPSISSVLVKQLSEDEEVKKKMRNAERKSPSKKANNQLNNEKNKIKENEREMDQNKEQEWKYASAVKSGKVTANREPNDLKMLNDKTHSKPANDSSKHNSSSTAFHAKNQNKESEKNTKESTIRPSQTKVVPHSQMLPPNKPVPAHRSVTDKDYQIKVDNNDNKNILNNKLISDKQTPLPDKSGPIVYDIQKGKTKTGLTEVGPGTNRQVREYKPETTNEKTGADKRINEPKVYNKSQNVTPSSQAVIQHPAKSAANQSKETTPCAKPRTSGANASDKTKQPVEQKKPQTDKITSTTLTPTAGAIAKSSKPPPQVPPRQSSLSDLTSKKTTNKKIFDDDEPKVLKEEELDGSDSFFLAVGNSGLKGVNNVPRSSDTVSDLHAPHNSLFHRLDFNSGYSSFELDENDTEGDFDHLLSRHCISDHRNGTGLKEDPILNDAIHSDVAKPSHQHGQIRGGKNIKQEQKHEIKKKNEQREENNIGKHKPGNLDTDMKNQTKQQVVNNQNNQSSKLPKTETKNYDTKNENISVKPKIRSNTKNADKPQRSQRNDGGHMDKHKALSQKDNIAESTIHKDDIKKIHGPENLSKAHDDTSYGANSSKDADIYAANQNLIRKSALGNKFPRMPLPSTTCSSAFTRTSSSISSSQPTTSLRDWKIDESKLDDLDTNLQHFEETVANMTLLSGNTSPSSKIDSDDEEEMLRSATMSMPTFPKGMLGAKGFSDPYYGTDNDDEISSYMGGETSRPKPKKLANMFMRRTTSTDSFEELLKQSGNAPRATHRGSLPGKSGGNKSRVTANDRRRSSKNSSLPSGLYDLTQESDTESSPKRSSSFSPSKNPNTLHIRQHGDDSWDRRHSLPAPADIPTVRTTFSDPSDLRLPPKTASMGSSDSRPSILVLGPSLESPNEKEKSEFAIHGGCHTYDRGANNIQKKTMVSSLSGDFDKTKRSSTMFLGSQCSSLGGVGMIADGFARCFSCGTLSTQAISESTSMNVQTNVVPGIRGSSPTKMTPRERIRSVDSSTQVSPTDELFPSERFAQEGLSLADLRKIKSLIEALNDKSDLDDLHISRQITKPLSHLKEKVITKSPTRRPVTIYKDASIMASGQESQIYPSDRIMYPRLWRSHSNIPTPTYTSNQGFFESDSQINRESSACQTESNGYNVLHPNFIENRAPPSLLSDDVRAYSSHGVASPYASHGYQHAPLGGGFGQPYPSQSLSGYHQGNFVPGNYGLVQRPDYQERRMYSDQASYTHMQQQQPPFYHSTVPEYNIPRQRDISSYSVSQYQQPVSNFFQPGQSTHSIHSQYSDVNLRAGGYSDRESYYGDTEERYPQPVTTQPKGRWTQREEYDTLGDNDHTSDLGETVNRSRANKTYRSMRSRDPSPAREIPPSNDIHDEIDDGSSTIKPDHSGINGLRKCASVPTVFRATQDSAILSKDIPPSRKSRPAPRKIAEEASDFYETEASGAEDIAEPHRSRERRRRHQYSRENSYPSDYEDDDHEYCKQDVDIAYPDSPYDDHYQAPRRRSSHHYGDRFMVDYEMRQAQSNRSHRHQPPHYSDHHSSRRKPHAPRSYSRHSDRDILSRRHYGGHSSKSSRPGFSRSYSISSQEFSRGMSHSSSRRSLPQPPEDDEYSWRYESVKRQSKINPERTMANRQQRADEHVQMEVSRLQQTMEDLDQEERELDLRLKYLEIGRSRRPSMTSLSLHEDLRHNGGQSMDNMRDHVMTSSSFRHNSRQRNESPGRDSSYSLYRNTATPLNTATDNDLSLMNRSAQHKQHFSNTSNPMASNENNQDVLKEIQHVTKRNYEIIDDVTQIEARGFQPLTNTTSDDDDGVENSHRRKSDRRTNSNETTRQSLNQQLPNANGERYRQHRSNNGGNSASQFSNGNVQRHHNEGRNEGLSNHRLSRGESDASSTTDPLPEDDKIPPFSFSGKYFPAFYARQGQYTHPASSRFTDSSSPLDIINYHGDKENVNPYNNNKKNGKNNYKTMTDKVNYEIQQRFTGKQEKFYLNSEDHQSENGSEYAELVTKTNDDKLLSSFIEIGQRDKESESDPIWIRRNEVVSEAAPGNNQNAVGVDESIQEQRRDDQGEDFRTVVSDSEGGCQIIKWG
ncbi:uncharacterized protein LOC120339386 isoform X2 [Styela clava]